MKLYRQFSTQEEIDAHYNVLGNVADPDAIIAAWAQRSEAAVARLECRLSSRPVPAHRSMSSSMAGTGAASPRATTTSSCRSW